LFDADPAGQAVLRVLRQAARAQFDDAADAQRWRIVFQHLCEQERFRAQDVASPVRMLPLLSMRLQRFDRVLVLGSASRHFLPSPPGLLPPAVAAELGLPGAMQAREQAIGALVELMCTTPSSALTFSEHAGGQSEQLLGVLERLRLYWMRHSLTNNRALGGHFLTTNAAMPESAPVFEKQWFVRLARSPITSVSQFTHALHETLPVKEGVPLRFSVAALSDLATCPLKFALQRALAWSDMPQVKTQTDARDRGELVHAVIETFHRKVSYEQLLTMPSDQLMLALDQSLEQVWNKYPAIQQAMIFGERCQWLRVAYRTLFELIERAKQGWRVVEQERALERETRFGQRQTPLTVYGRCDRIEKKGEQFAVIDIKTGNVNKFKKQAKDPMSFTQLAAYQWMFNQSDTDLAYLNIDTEKVQWIPVQNPENEDVAQWGTLWVEQLQQTLARLFDEHEPVRPLPSDACTTCNVAGSCRAAWWSVQS